jgi:hypothetical protein
MSRTLRPLAVLAMLTLSGVIGAGCGFERIFQVRLRRCRKLWRRQQLQHRRPHRHPGKNDDHPSGEGRISVLGGLGTLSGTAALLDILAPKELGAFTDVRGLTGVVAGSKDVAVRPLGKGAGVNAVNTLGGEV